LLWNLGIYYEKERTRYEKEKILKSLAEYLCTRGDDAYICPIKSTPKRSDFVPYIYTEEELRNVFQSIDQYPPHPRSNRNIVDPLLFRMLYGCGLRISEALNLKVPDVNLDEGTLTILNGKNNKSRIIPMAESLIHRSIEY
jgi:integrase